MIVSASLTEIAFHLPYLVPARGHGRAEDEFDDY